MKLIGILFALSLFASGCSDSTPAPGTNSTNPTNTTNTTTNTTTNP